MNAARRIEPRRQGSSRGFQEAHDTSPERMVWVQEAVMKIIRRSLGQPEEQSESHTESIDRTRVDPIRPGVISGTPKLGTDSESCKENL